MSSSNKIINLINVRSFLSLLLTPTYGFFINRQNAKTNSIFWDFEEASSFGFGSPDFSLCFAYVKSEQCGHESGPERGGVLQGPVRGI